MRTTTCMLLLAAIAATVPAFAERRVALVIGNDHYQHVQPLRTAGKDARSVEALLRDKFGFETTLLIDASRAQIISALSRYRTAIGADASVLIYYGGHGFLDSATDRAYWWPVDATQGDPSEWISADDITSAVKAMPAKHVLIVSDSCFSGTLTRGVTPSNFQAGTDRANMLAKLNGRASRELLSSGGNEPVADGGGGEHSVFAAAFLRALGEMQPSQFAAEEIFHQVRESVGGRSQQLPQFDAIRNSGHDGGSFVFTRAGAALPAAQQALTMQPPAGALRSPTVLPPKPAAQTKQAAADPAPANDVSRTRLVSLLQMKDWEQGVNFEKPCLLHTEQQDRSSKEWHVYHLAVGAVDPTLSKPESLGFLASIVDISGWSLSLRTKGEEVYKFSSEADKDGNHTLKGTQNWLKLYVRSEAEGREALQILTSLAAGCR